MINGEQEKTQYQGNPEAAAPPADLASLQKTLEEEKTKVLQYLYNWQRAQADLLNYKKTSEREKQDAVKYGNSMLVLNLLPVLDDLERAVGSLPTGSNAGWMEGIRLIQKKLLGVLQAGGLVPLESVGQRFDPFVHEAVSYQEGEENKVLAEVEKGYKFQDRLLRPAKVIVGKGKKENPEFRSQNSG